MLSLSAGVGVGDGAARLTLVLGGARSGKSRYAEGLIMAAPPPWTYLATAEPGDAEMAARIAAHRARRGAGWQTVEAPHDLAAAVAMLPRQATVLIDCMTLWLSNRMLARIPGEADRHAGSDFGAINRGGIDQTGVDSDSQADRIGRAIEQELDALAAALGCHDGAAVIVANEVGLSIVPDNALGRQFRDLQGRVNQRLAALAGRVVLIVAGLPLALKEPRSGTS